MSGSSIWSCSETWSRIGCKLRLSDVLIQSCIILICCWVFYESLILGPEVTERLVGDSGPEVTETLVCDDTISQSC